MSNITPERRSKATGGTDRKIAWGEAYTCRDGAGAFMRTKRPQAVVLGDHVSCYEGVSFALGERAMRSAISALLNAALIMADERIEIGRLF
jgi:hypothetical protein